MGAEWVHDYAQRRRTDPAYLRQAVLLSHARMMRDLDTLATMVSMEDIHILMEEIRTHTREYTDVSQ